MDGVDESENYAGWQGGTSISAEHNKALVRRFLEAHEGKADLDALDQMLAPDFVSHIKRLPGQQPDREGYKWAIAQYSAAFSDRKFLVEEQVGEADTVVSRFTVRATHDSKEIMGVAPTDREVSYKGIAIHRIVGAKITEEWTLATTGPRLLEQRLKQEWCQRERIEQELLVARRIQQASLPKEVPELEGWKISPLYRSAREVGGDFYDFNLLPEGRLGVVVGDATGKGVPAALVMSTTCGMLQLAAQALGSSLPGEVLAQVNEALVARIPTSMFVTCFYAILDPTAAA
jgi:predicted ester cyclase